jgi:hypothetical protein|tara:strand:+ start:1497 stop:1658 length:162 start_codon:yes stop_codon:yes gene_type:complete
MLILRHPFERIVHLVHSPPHEETAAQEQNQVAPRDPFAQHGEEIGGQLHDPGQ